MRKKRQQKHAQQIFMLYVFVGVFSLSLSHAYISFVYIRRLLCFEIRNFKWHISLWLLNWSFCCCELLLFWINCCCLPKAKYLRIKRRRDDNDHADVQIGNVREGERAKERIASILASMYEMMWKSYKLFEMNGLPDPYQLWPDGRKTLHKIWLCVCVYVVVYLEIPLFFSQP